MPAGRTGGPEPHVEAAVVAGSATNLQWLAGGSVFDSLEPGGEGEARAAAGGRARTPPSMAQF